MPEVDAAPPPGNIDVPDKNLIARAIGVVISPRETYAAIVARPRVLGALALVILIIVGVSTAFSMSKVGKDLTVEMTLDAMDSMSSMGIRVPDEVYTQTEDRIRNQPPWGSAIGQLVFFPVIMAIFAGIIFAVYTSLMGGDGTFKQTFAVVVYSGFLIALQTLFIYPMFYLKQSMASPTSLAVFMPFLPEASFLGRLISAVDLFRLWWIVNLAIGVAVLYKRRTSSIAWTMLAVYAAIALVSAAVRTAFSGA